MILMPPPKRFKLQVLWSRLSHAFSDITRFYRFTLTASTSSHANQSNLKSDALSF